MEVISGEGFSTRDPLEVVFPTMDAREIRQMITDSLKRAYKEHRYTAIKEELEFDEHGLLVGQYVEDSFIGQLGLREKNDIKEFAKRVPLENNFDVEFEYDEETKRGALVFKSKRYEVFPSVHTHQARI